MCADGGAEEVADVAIGGWRNDVSLVSNVHPHNASRKGVGAACTRSLKRLGTNRLDLLHWRSQIIHEQDPATGEPWTPTAVDAVEAGLEVVP